MDCRTLAWIELGFVLAEEADRCFGCPRSRHDPCLLHVSLRRIPHFVCDLQIKADWYYADIGEGQVFDTNVKASIGTFRITINWLGY